jgi:hypothetical protein
MILNLFAERQVEEDTSKVLLGRINVSRGDLQGVYIIVFLSP